MARRRAGFVVLPALLVGGALLSVLPEGAGAIRIAGVSLTWWYAIVLAPAVATLVGFVAGAPGDIRSLLLWATPALVVPLATQVFAAAPAAPLVALAAAGDDRVGHPPRHRARCGGGRDDRHPVAGMESPRLAASRRFHPAQPL